MGESSTDGDADSDADGDTDGDGDSDSDVEEDGTSTAMPWNVTVQTNVTMRFTAPYDELWQQGNTELRRELRLD